MGLLCQELLLEGSIRSWETLSLSPGERKMSYIRAGRGLDLHERWLSLLSHYRYAIITSSTDSVSHSSSPYRVVSACQNYMYPENVRYHPSLSSWPPLHHSPPLDIATTSYNWHAFPRKTHIKNLMHVWIAKHSIINCAAAATSELCHTVLSLTVYSQSTVC